MYDVNLQISHKFILDPVVLEDFLKLEVCAVCTVPEAILEPAIAEKFPDRVLAKWIGEDLGPDEVRERVIWVVHWSKRPARIHCQFSVEDGVIVRTPNLIEGPFFPNRRGADREKQEELERLVVDVCKEPVGITIELPEPLVEIEIPEWIRGYKRYFTYESRIDLNTAPFEETPSMEIAS